MNTASIFGVVFGILVSLQLLSSISTCRPLIMHTYHSGSKSNGHINNHSSDPSIDIMKNLHMTSSHFHNRRHDAPLVPALFAFGDSTVDAGTNNHLVTISRSDFIPYGRDLADKKPTGRFCNGQLVTDYIASKLGLGPKMIAYLDIRKDAHKRLGCLNMPLHLEVSFASASSGFYDSTAKHFNALPLKKQLNHFKDFKKRMIKELGEEDAIEVLGKAMFIVSTGTNDFLNNYLINPYLRSKYSLPQFQTLVLELCAQFIKDIYELGARRVGVVSLPPFGCLPAIRTIYKKGDGYGCVNHLNNYAMTFNQELQGVVFPILQENLSGLHLAYMDSNSVLLDIVNNPTKYGLEQARKACCGSGKLEVGIFCNKLSIGTCKDATQYAFWDSFHPTDKTNEILATMLLEQVWKAFNIDDSYVYYYKHPLAKVQNKGPNLLLSMEQWRSKMFVLGALLYIMHLFKQFFPKIIDLGI